MKMISTDCTIRPIKMLCRKRVNLAGSAHIKTYFPISQSRKRKWGMSVQKRKGALHFVKTEKKFKLNQ